MNKLLNTDNPVTNVLTAVVEQAIQDYLTTKLYLYRLERNDTKLLESLRRINKTPEWFKEECETALHECIDFFIEGDYKALYGNLSGMEVIARLIDRFTNEVIPEFEKTGKWFYKRQGAESE